MKEVKNILIAAAAFGVIYLAGAFANASFYIGTWSEFARAMTAAIGMVCAAGVYGAVAQS